LILLFISYFRFHYWYIIHFRHYYWFSFSFTLSPLIIDTLDLID
jgi:hypothetical protein